MVFVTKGHERFCRCWATFISPSLCAAFSPHPLVYESRLSSSLWPLHLYSFHSCTVIFWKLRTQENFLYPLSLLPSHHWRSHHLKSQLDTHLGTAVKTSCSMSRLVQGRLYHSRGAQCHFPSVNQHMQHVNVNVQGSPLWGHNYSALYLLTNPGAILLPQMLWM